MKTSNLKNLLFLVLIMVGLGLNAQNGLWKKIRHSEIQDRTLEQRNSTPQEFDLFKLDTYTLKKVLAHAPERFTTFSDIIIQLPTSEGVLQQFRVYEASTLAPELQQKHPTIRSYAAQGIEDPSAVARFSVSSIGVNVMISSPNYPTVYIDPYTTDKEYYIVYRRDQLPVAEPFECLVEAAAEPEMPTQSNLNANDGLLRTFRLALACTGEYASYHLARQGVPSTATDAVKKAAILSEMNLALTRINGIFERDVALSMVLVPNNEEVIFLNAASDPYTNQNAGVMLGQNQATCDQKIGFSNYDIGHVFSTGGGGIAQLKSPCMYGQKARGVTGLPSPTGDPFWIDFVCHEMGHQYGANHVFNGTEGNCGGGNRNLSTAVEVGSGSTIMSYAGTCGSINVQNHSDDYFNAISIQEMWANIKSGNSTCSTKTSTNNSAPIANAGANYTIPKSTPFILTGSATDPDGDALTYNWEQMNPDNSVQPPVTTATKGPVFRSMGPSNDPSRFFPKITYILSDNLGGPGTSNKWEVVPSVSRTMNFRFTVRDNVAGGGATASSNMQVTVDGNSGPFKVTSQVQPAVWQTETTETITWDVAGTDTAPVNASHVDIFFSTNYGLTYPVTIALNVPNTGSAVVNVPNLNTSQGRIMVRGSNNIFFNVSKGTITVQGTVGTDDNTFKDFAVYPNPSNGIFNLTFTPDSTERIEVSLFDLRGRLINQLVYDDNTTQVFNKQLDYNYIENGIYFLMVKNGDKSVTKKLIKK